MGRILLADDSPHAQRMGERILREEGYEVVSVTDGDTAIKRLTDVDPDLIVVDVFLPGKNGFELCRQVKSNPLHRHVKVVMTAGMLEVFDEDEARRSGADAIIKKPFEASMVIDSIKPLIAEARAARTSEPAPEAEIEEQPAIDIQPVVEASTVTVVVEEPEPQPAPVAAPEPVAAFAPPVAVPPPTFARTVSSTPAFDVKPVETVTAAPPPPAPIIAADVDVELVRAAVTVAVDELMPFLVDEITERVLAALRENR